MARPSETRPWRLPCPVLPATCPAASLPRSAANGGHCRHRRCRHRRCRVRHCRVRYCRHRHLRRGPPAGAAGPRRSAPPRCGTRPTISGAVCIASGSRPCSTATMPGAATRRPSACPMKPTPSRPWAGSPICRPMRAIATDPGRRCAGTPGMSRNAARGSRGGASSGRGSCGRSGAIAKRDGGSIGRPGSQNRAVPERERDNRRFGPAEPRACAVVACACGAFAVVPAGEQSLFIYQNGCTRLGCAPL